MAPPLNCKKEKRGRHMFSPVTQEGSEVHRILKDSGYWPSCAYRLPSGFSEASVVLTCKSCARGGSND
eukprot:1160064-Pelagomonas_calceolata.AAC.7